MVILLVRRDVVQLMVQMKQPREGRARLHTARKMNTDESKHRCGLDNLAGTMEGGMDYNHLR
jgi:hypothetical protein